MANKCKTGEVYDTKLKKCRRNVRRKNQAMGKSEKKVGKVLDVLLKSNPATMTYKTLKYAIDEDVHGQMKGLTPKRKPFPRNSKDYLILGKGGYGGKKPVRPKKKK